MAESDNSVPSDETNPDGVATEETTAKLNLDVSIDQRGACQRHVRVTVAREDIDRYFNKEFSELMESAQVPGFRPGHAPRKLVENRFRKEVTPRVKSALLMDSIAQTTTDEKLAAISEPDFDVDAVELPHDGPMTFEFDIEVRPEFDLPKWKGMKLEKPVRQFSPEDVDRALQNLLSRRGRLVPKDGPAAAGDFIVATLVFTDEDKKEVSKLTEETIRLRPVLSFRDCKVEKFDKSMAGVKAGQSRTLKAQISADAPNAQLRGKSVDVLVEVQEVKSLEVPELTPELLSAMGGFESEADLRDAVKDSLDRRLSYHQHQHAREQITKVLTVSASWELPPEMLKRQSHREMQRALLELQRSGFSEEEVLARENELRQNILSSTSQALKEHFILERIAEEEKIEPQEADYEAEIRLIAAQLNESPRRVRARLEKQGSMDVLHNQVVERKVIDLILANAEFKEVPYKPDDLEAEAIDEAVGGEDESDIPQAKPEGAHAEHGKAGPPSAES